MRRPGDHPPHEIEAVRAAVERRPRLVDAGLAGQQPDRLAGDVGCVGDQDVDAAPQRRGQRLVEVTLLDPTTGGEQVAAGAPHRGGVDVDGVQLDPVQGRDKRGADRARAAAQVDDDSPATGSRPGVSRLGRPASQRRRPGGRGTRCGGAARTLQRPR